MNIRLIRTFHPVGQGAFYSEEFKGEGGDVLFRVLYDCGCIWGDKNQKHGMQVLGEQISQWKGTGHSGIDYLFISHFDFDHVSLLKTLKDGGVKVERVISPLLENDEKVALTNFYEGVFKRNESEFLGDLIENPGKALGGENIWVAPLKADGRLSDEDFSVDVASGDHVASGTRFPVDIPNADLDWRYIPCNFEIESRGLEFREALKKKFGERFDPKTLEGFPGLMKLYGRGKRRAFRKLKAVYDSVEGNINENSMIVYSGPVDCEGKDWKCVGQSMLSCNSSKCPPQHKLPCVALGNAENRVKGGCGPACIYTGDADLKVTAIDVWYRDFWHFVGTIQVPHHGSRLSFNHSIFCHGCYQCPISCSDNCYYKHPHACVTNALTADGSIPIRVTESVGLCQEFDMSLGQQMGANA